MHCSNLDVFLFQQFKWQVQESKPLRGTTPTREVAHRRESYSNGDEYEHNGLNGENEVNGSNGTHGYEVEDELPPAAYTRSLVSKFQSLEDPNQPAPTPEVSARHQKVAYSSVLNPGPTRRFASNTSSINAHEENSYNHELDYEQETEHEHDFAHEAHGNDYDIHYGHNDYDSDDEPRSPTGGYTHHEVREEELPEQGMTRNLLAKFQALQA